ncbi:condensation domain-containing protein, partial [Mucilaginibacter angelicae]|uniref:condensation domain-containing protein n=1 Tax=Mucilaginibacter angelicae TaxID=869718 RepID=UPI00406BCCC1
MALLSSGFSRLISRHEVLRTVFRENGSGDVRQYILSPEELGFHMKEHDFRGDEDAQEQVKEEVREFVNESFDLAEGPLLRALLCRLSEDRWVFAYVMHHIISDGWSMEVLIGEVLEYYNSGKAGSPVQLQPLRIQYKDYAAWQQSVLSAGAQGAHAAYWQEV